MWKHFFFFFRHCGDKASTRVPNSYQDSRKTRTLIYIMKFCKKAWNELRWHWTHWYRNQLFVYNFCSNCTLWGFQNFSTTQILCEKNFSDSRSLKNCPFCTFRGSKFYFWHISALRVWKVLMWQYLELLESQKLISRKF